MAFTKWLTLGLMIPALGLGGLALAGGDGPRHARGGAAPWAGVVHQLELTAEQQAMVDAWKEAARSDRASSKADRLAERDVIKAQLTSAKPDAAALHAIVSARASEREARAHAQLDRFLALHATLTPEQRQQIGEILEARPERRGEGARGPRGPGGEHGKRYRK